MKPKNLSEPRVESDELQQRVAKAIYKSQVDSVKGIICSRLVNSDKIIRVFSSISHESDRAAAILIYSLFDDLLTDLFRNELNPEIKDGVDKLFKPHGLLSTSLDKIDLAYALYWISEELYSALNVLRKVRNSFAHNIDNSSFADEKIYKELNKLLSYEDLVWENLDHDDGPQRFGLNAKILLKNNSSMRDRFLVRSCVLAARVLQAINILPLCRAYKVSPSSILDDPPESLNLAIYNIAEVTLSITKGICDNLRDSKIKPSYSSS